MLDRCRFHEKPGFQIDVSGSQINSSLPEMTGGEKRIAQSLEDNLEEDYIIWYDVPVGKKNLRPDFTILHPQRGLLVLEVKDWKLSTIQNADRKRFTIKTDNGIKSVLSPLEQARKYVLAINSLLCNDKDLIQHSGRYKGQLICPYGYGVVLANVTRKAFIVISSLVQWLECLDSSTFTLYICL